MIKTQIGTDGSVLPPYGFMNDDEYKKIQPKESICILYSMKASVNLNSKIHGNAYSRINSGKVRFLITEQEAKSMLLSTKKGQKMSMYDRQKRLLPHEQTTLLFNQCANLRLKTTGNPNDIMLERINRRYPKDKFSSMEYGLWRIKEREEQNAGSRHSNTKRQLVFYTGGNY